MDEVFAAPDTLDRETLAALTRRSDAKGLVRLAGHAAALGGSAALIAAIGSGPWLVPAMALHGVLLVFLFAPLHETIHRTAFRHRWLNDAVAWLCGAVVLLPPAYFRAFHFAHHRHTQDEARDPELLTARPRSLGGYLWLVSGVVYWRGQIVAILRHAAGRADEPFIAPGARARVVAEARILLGVYAGAIAASAAAASWAIALYWLAPMLLGQPVLRLYLMAEHTGLPLVDDMLRNARTIRSNALVRFFAWNMPYHAEHHAFPGVPFHALPALHARIAGRIAVHAPGYFAVHRRLIRQLV